MKLNNKIRLALLALSLASVGGNLQAQNNNNYTPQSVENLFDANSNTSWVSSFNGETFPIQLEINLAILEEIQQLLLQQTTSSDLQACRVKEFAIYAKETQRENYPTEAIYTGTMEDSNGAQTFTLPKTISAQYLRIEIRSVYGEETLQAALAEVGIVAAKSNADILSASFDYSTPWSWSGVTWSKESPYTVQQISWTNRTLTGDIYLADFSELTLDNTRVSQTQITVHDNTTHIDDVPTTELEQVEEGPYYNLQGQPVTNPTRGIYIKNGKKVIIR